MANGTIQDPIGTTTKVRTFLNGLIADLETTPINSRNIKQIVDLAYLLDDIHKTANKYVGKLKKQLTFKQGQYEINGTIGRAHLDIHHYSDIPPAAFQKEVTPEIFLGCIKVDLAAAKKAIPEERIEQIKVPSRTAEKITMLPLSK